MTGQKRKAAGAVGKRGGRGPSMAVRRACFIEVLRRTGNVSRAAREAGLASGTVYGQRARNANFAADWDAAVNEAMDELEAELLERAKHGVEKPVFFRGAQVGSVRTYSDALAMFVLRARRPQVYDRIVAVPAARSVEEMTEEEAKAEVIRRLDLIVARGARMEALPAPDVDDDASGDDGE